jgi:hypothetical protein
MAARASAVRGTRVVYDKEGTDPGQCHEHHIPHSHQRRRRLRDRLHSRTGEDDTDAHLKRNATRSGGCGHQRPARLWHVERIFSGQVERLARESGRPAAEAGAGQEPQEFLRNHRGVGALRAILTPTDADCYVWCTLLRSSWLGTNIVKSEDLQLDNSATAQRDGDRDQVT